MRHSIPFLGGTACFVLLSVACGGQSSTSPSGATPPAVTSLSVSGTAPLVGATSPFTATAMLSDGTTQNVTAQASWRSLNVSVATVSTSGVVSGVGPGEADITATYGSVSGSQHVRIALRTFAVSGTVADDRGRGVTNAAVKVVDGDNAGISSTTDQNGSYTLSGLRAGSFAIRAQADGFEPIDKQVTIDVADLRVDFNLRGLLCAYVARPDSAKALAAGGPQSADLVRTAGGCSWQAASTVSWLTITGRSSNSNSDTLTYVVAPQPLFEIRRGTIGIQWSGGNVSLTVEQWPCEYLDIPASVSFLANGQSAILPENSFVYVGVTDTVHGGCNFYTENAATWLTTRRTNIGFIMEAAANPSPTPRSTLVRVNFIVGGRNITVTQSGR